MDLDTANSIEVITVSTSSTPGSSGKKVVPLQIGYKKVPLIECSDIVKLRRPVRPIDRQRMRPWLMELLDLGNVFGLRWTNRHQGVFQISWRHASRLGWNLETDGDVFERWARHTGIYREGDPPEPKRWKANFRCALHSLHDVVELTSAVERKGRNACRTYRFLHSTDQQSIFRKKLKSRKVKEPPEKPYERISIEETPVAATDSASSEDGISECESDWSQEDKVIVQELNLKGEIPEEEYGLHHDHDYSALPDKTQKTIVLRQGVGSIVLHKEILSAPDDGESDKNLLISNLDQLASAAMSTAGMDNSHRRPAGLKQIIKVEEQSEQSGDDYLPVHFPDTKLQCLLSSPAEHTGHMTTRKRKTSKDESKSDSQSTNATPKKGPKKKPLNIVSVFKNVSTPQPLSPPASVQRSGSPKILCRRSKRNSSKSEKSAGTAEVQSSSSESTEPLMSSCLLLLEAATRLDNAEKNGKTGSQQSESSVREASDVEMANTVETSSEGLSKVYGKDETCKGKIPGPKVHHLIINDETQKSVPAIKSSIIQTVLTEKSLIKHDGNMILSEAKGLFSGSNIHSSVQSTVSRKSNEPAPPQQIKPSYIFVTRATDAEQGDTVHESSAKSLLGTHHIIIKKNLPILKATSEPPLVIQNASPLQTLLKKQDSGSIVKGSLERSNNASHVSLTKAQPIVTVGDKSRAALRQGNMISIISPLNSSETVLSPKVLVTTPLMTNTLTPLSTVSNLVTSTPVLVNASYNVNTHTQGGGNTPTAGKGPSLITNDLGKTALKGIKIQMVPGAVGRTQPSAAVSTSGTPASTGTPQNTSSSISSCASPAFITSKRTLLELPNSLLSSSMKANLKHSMEEGKVALLPVCIRRKSTNDGTDSKQVVLLRAIVPEKPSSNLSQKKVPGQIDSKSTNDNSMLCNSVGSSSVDSFLDGHEDILDETKKGHITGHTVKPLAELCKPYLSQLFSTLDSQSSESEDSDSTGETLKLDQSQNITLNCSDSQSSKHEHGEKLDPELMDAADSSISEYSSASDTVHCGSPLLSHVSLLARDESHEQIKDSALTVSGESIPMFATVDLTPSHNL